MNPMRKRRRGTFESVRTGQFAAMLVDLTADQEMQ